MQVQLTCAVELTQLCSMDPFGFFFKASKILVSKSISTTSSSEGKKPPKSTQQKFQSFPPSLVSKERGPQQQQRQQQQSLSCVHAPYLNTRACKTVQPLKQCPQGVRTVAARINFAVLAQREEVKGNQHGHARPLRVIIMLMPCLWRNL